MKHFQFLGSQLTPQLRDKISELDEGIYVVYGAFIDGVSLNLTRLYKGQFKDIKLRIDDPNRLDPETVVYLLPVPEFLVNYDDPEYAKYLNIHLVPSSDIEDDETMLRKFCEAYTRQLSAVGAEEAADNENVGAGTEAEMRVAEETVDQIQENLERLQQSTALMQTLVEQTQRERDEKLALADATLVDATNQPSP